MKSGRLFFIAAIFSSNNVFAEHRFEQEIAPILNDLVELAHTHKNNAGSPIPVVAIAGSFAVGKSFFASLLIKALHSRGISAKIVREDNFLKFQSVAGANPIHPRLDAKAIRALLSGIALGKLQVKQPSLNMDKNGYSITQKNIDYTNVDIILFEGVYSLCGPGSFDFRRYSAFGIFMEASEKNIYQWDWDRNQAKPKIVRKSKKEFKKSFYGYLSNYKQYILPYRKEAKYIIYKPTKSSYTLACK